MQGVSVTEQGDSGMKRDKSCMDWTRIYIMASAAMALIYIASVVQAGYLSAFAITFLVFIAGVAYALKKSEPFLIIICGEILVINNPAILSSLVIQFIVAFLFFTLYVSNESRLLGGICTGYLVITSVCAYGALRMQAFAYLLLCITALICGYIIIQMHGRKMKRKTTEGL